MTYQVVRLNSDHLDKLLPQVQLNVEREDIEKAYFSEGSIAYCLLADGEPVFAGGVVNGQWNRGEIWMLPTPFFRSHVRDCYRRIKDIIPLLAIEGGFKRVQATCSVMISTRLFEHLGFEYEGTMKCWGKNGETCHMYARFF